MHIFKYGVKSVRGTEYPEEALKKIVGEVRITMDGKRKQLHHRIAEFEKRIRRKRI